jgi:spermidine synthase
MTREIPSIDSESAIDPMRDRPWAASGPSRFLLAPFVLTLLVSSSLIFLVQPMVGKMVLPLLGGVPAVWTTSILFFQATLLAGYAYAHFAVNRLGPRRQAVVQLALVLVPLAFLPIGLPGDSAPPAESNPIPWLLATLALSAGLPLFVVSSTGPVIQRWFAATRHRSARDPYFLFAASNLGSLLGLLAYPLVVERTLSLDDQARLWAGGYLLLVALSAGCAVTLWRGGRQFEEGSAEDSDAPAPNRHRRIRWVVLSFVPSSLMLGVTAQITSEIAPIPLLWVVGLALYLVTLIVTVAVRNPSPPRALLAVLPVLVVAVVVVTFLKPTHGTLVLVLNLVTFVVAALVCHGQLAADRPAGRHLTDFYLWIGLGGALGGIFNALFAPQVFNGIVEYPLVLLFACFLHPRLLTPDRFWSRPRGLALLAFGAFVLASVATTAGQREVLAADRSFFGVYKVKALDRDEGRYHALVAGNTLHGLQSLDPARAREPLLYFHRGGPIGQVFGELRRTRPVARVAVIGLGAGSMACYARPGDTWTFLELDPAVERIARDPRLFTLLRRCQPDARIVLGDGRLSLARSRAPDLDLLAVDAFNSESVPVHLLTREALAIYTRRLAPRGLLVFHVSNHYVDMQTVLANLAADAGLTAFERNDRSAGREQGRAPSRWVVMARSAADLGPLPRQQGWRRLEPDAGKRLWTDQYSDVLSVLR